MKRIVIFMMLTLAAAVALAACGGGNTNDGDGTPAATQLTEAEAANAKEIVITATNWEFDQEEYTITKGEPVKFTLVNEEGVHALEIKGMDIEVEGESTAAFIPNEAGEYTIYCTIPCGAGHAKMKATLIVA